MELVRMLKVVGTVRNEAFVQCSVSGPSLDTLSRTDYKADHFCSSRGFGAAFPASDRLDNQRLAVNIMILFSVFMSEANAMPSPSTGSC